MGTCNAIQRIGQPNQLAAEIDSKLLIASALNNKEKKMLLIGPEYAGKSLILKQIDCIYNNNGNFDIKKYFSLINNIRNKCIKFTLNICTMINDQKSYELIEKHEMQHQYQRTEIGEYLEKIWRLNKEKLILNYEYEIEYISYFMDKIKDIMDNEYMLTEHDILCHHPNPKFMEIEIKNKLNDQIWRVIKNTKRWHNQKKLYLFGQVSCVIFVASLDDYCKIYKLNGMNAMKDSLNYFQEILHSKWLNDAQKIVILNKDDVFRMKLKNGQSLSICFGDDWNGPEFPNYKIHLIVSYIIRNIKVMLDRFNFYVPTEIIDIITSYSRLKYMINDNEVDENEYFEYCYKQSLQFITNKYRICQFNAASCTSCRLRRVHVLVTNAMDRNNLQSIWKDIEQIVLSHCWSQGGTGFC